MPKIDYTRNVFINCPFDDDYLPIFRAIVFTVIDCGYIPRCALELEDSTLVRIEKITRIISECKYGIHDISRTESDRKTNLPRFNMPLELGIFLGARRFGDKEQTKKACLILDRDRYRYQSFISDIAGQDIQSHDNSDLEAINVIRNWLRNVSARSTISGGKEIQRRYALFKSELPILCEKLKLGVDEMIFNDYTHLVYEWLR